MRHGRLWLILIFCLQSLILPLVQAEEMSAIQRDHWLVRPDLSEKVDELMVLVKQNDIETLDFSIQSLAFPQQEVIRFLLLQRLQSVSTPFSIETENFVASHRLLAPKYHLVEKGNGFEFLFPAFDYPAVASRLMNEWQRDHDTKEFVANVELRLLDFKQWLTGEPDVVEKRQALLLGSLDQLEKSDIEYLVNQITGPDVVSWLPSNQVMVELAKASHNQALYKLLWLMRSDLYSENEVLRLGNQNTEFALEQLILASQNPRLKQKALTAITRSFPMRDFVRDYLMAQLNQDEDVNFVARQLIHNGYQTWLKELVAAKANIKREQVELELKR